MQPNIESGLGFKHKCYTIFFPVDSSNIGEIGEILKWKFAWELVMGVY